ncbi:MAG TPA: branched-chain amino acid ABC transporter permease [Spirochaetia bacterium]|nr:branched-chain amino acid ABC transporter permease [Spirochaetia bacterium]
MHITATELLQHFINGLTLGSIYALIALGYTMVYGILKFINFAHGDIMTMGTYVGLLSYTALIGKSTNPLWIIVSFVIAMLFAMTASAVLGVLVERVAYKPLRKAPRLAPLISAIGVSIILMNTAAFIFGTKSRDFPYPFDNTAMNISGVAVTPNQILILAVSLALMIGLKLFVDYSRLGKAMRATSLDQGVASLMGINVNFIISLTFFIGSALAATAGVLVATEYTVYPTMGALAGLKAFIAAVVGGIGNITGAMIGGILLGVLETFGVVILGIPQGYKDTIAFGVLIIILLVKPSGIMGKSTREKV